MAVSYTPAQYQQLCDMIAKGVTSLSQNGETVTFRSFDDMLRTKKLMEADLGLRPRKSRQHYPTVTRG